MSMNWMKKLIDYGADINIKCSNICSTPLGCAARYGNIDMMLLLLGHGAKVDVTDDRGFTALSEAVSPLIGNARSLYLIDILLNADADQNLSIYDDVEFIDYIIKFQY